MLVSYRPLAHEALRKARHRAYGVGELTDQSFPVSKYCCDAHERFSKAFAATHLWTNSRVLIGMFKNDMFYCTPDKPCGCANHISVRPVSGAGYRARDAAWWPVEFASLVARVLANRSPPRVNDAVKPKLECYSAYPSVRYST